MLRTTSFNVNSAVQINLNIMFPKFLKYLIFFVASGCFDSSDDLRDNDPAHVLDVPKDEEEEAVGKKDQPQCPVHS